MSKKKKAKKLKAEKKAKKAVQTPVKQAKTTNWNLLTLIAILAISFIAFFPSLSNGFVNWDDDINIYNNEFVTKANFENLVENTINIFKSNVGGTYIPLTTLSLAVDNILFGLEKPGFWHFHNILLHLLSVILVYFIGLRLKLNKLSVIILTVLFAIHPMRVESVTWLTERKDVLFGFYYLAAILLYIKGKQEGFKTKTLVLLALCFTLSLFAKIQAVILPISLLLVDYYLSKEAKISFKNILNKTPLFLGSLAIGLTNIYFLKNNEAFAGQSFEGIDRIFIGAFSLVTYYIKSLVPFELSPLYVYPETLSLWHYLAVVPFLGTFALLAYAYFKKWRVTFFGLGFFIVNILLLLQIVGAAQGYLADRFTYIAYFGLFFMMAYGFNELYKRKTNLQKPLLVLAGIIGLFYCFQTFNQTKIWKDGETLWTHVLKNYDNSTLAWRNRGNVFRDRGENSKAIADYNEALKINPNNAPSHVALAKMYYNYTSKDSIRKGLQHDLKAAQIDPNKAEYQVNAAATLTILNDYKEALPFLNKAEELDPNYADTYRNKAAAFIGLRDNEEALLNIDKYLKFKPNSDLMWYQKARIANLLKQHKEALEAGLKANRLKKDQYHYYEIAVAQHYLGRGEEAKTNLRLAQKMGFKGSGKIIVDILNN